MSVLDPKEEHIYKWKRDRKLQIEDFCSEKTLAEILEVKREKLYKLRTEGGLPYIQLGDDQRIYYLPHVMQWLLAQEKPWALKPPIY